MVLHHLLIWLVTSSFSINLLIYCMYVVLSGHRIISNMSSQVAADHVKLKLNANRNRLLGCQAVMIFVEIGLFLEMRQRNVCRITITVTLIVDFIMKELLANIFYCLFYAKLLSHLLCFNAKKTEVSIPFNVWYTCIYLCVFTWHVNV